MRSRYFDQPGLAILPIFYGCSKLNSGVAPQERTQKQGSDWWGAPGYSLILASTPCDRSSLIVDRIIVQFRILCPTFWELQFGGFQKNQGPPFGSPYLSGSILRTLIFGSSHLGKLAHHASHTSAKRFSDTILWTRFGMAR